MHVGVAFFATDRTPDIRAVATAAEQAGFESLWVPEHSHVPVARTTPYPMGGELPEKYARVLDPFVALTAAACATSTLRLGTGVCLVAQRDPVLTAKEAATVDLLSGGRLLLGIGAGWNADEMRHHGTEPAQRWDVMRERVLAMQRLWADDEASFTGEHVRLDASWQWPKPLAGTVPVLVGGAGPRAMRQAVDYADGWMPLPDRRFGSMTERMALLGRLAAERGRAVPSVTAYAVRPDRAVLGHFADLGLERSVVMLGDESDAVRELDRLGRELRLS